MKTVRIHVGKRMLKNILKSKNTKLIKAGDGNDFRLYEKINYEEWCKYPDEKYPISTDELVDFIINNYKDIDVYCN